MQTFLARIDNSSLEVFQYFYELSRVAALWARIPHLEIYLLKDFLIWLQKRILQILCKKCFWTSGSWNYATFLWKPVFQLYF